MFSVYSSRKVTILFLHVMALLESIVAMLRNIATPIVTTVCCEMTIVGTLLGGFGLV